MRVLKYVLYQLAVKLYVSFFDDLSDQLLLDLLTIVAIGRWVVRPFVSLVSIHEVLLKFILPLVSSMKGVSLAILLLVVVEAELPLLVGLLPDKKSHQVASPPRVLGTLERQVVLHLADVAGCLQGSVIIIIDTYSNLFNGLDGLDIVLAYQVKVTLLDHEHFCEVSSFG